MTINDPNGLSKVTGLLGLANRARQIVSGEELSLNIIRKGDAAVAFIDEATGPNTRKRFMDACAYRHAMLASLPEGALGAAIGKPNRMVAVATKGSLSESLRVAVLNAGLRINATASINDDMVIE